MQQLCEEICDIYNIRKYRRIVILIEVLSTGIISCVPEKSAAINSY